MIPRVFVSSTIRDLSHIRHAVRDCIGDLGYQPVMSDYGEVGYLPDTSAAESCFREAEHCDLGILIVGKRYGDDFNSDQSVTHGEFRTLHQKKIPVLTLLERDVMTYKNLNETNGLKELCFPGMDRHAKTFQFVDEIAGSPYNNGIHEFHNLNDIRQIVKTQFAHIVGMLLRERFDPIRGEIRDILASVASLREELVEQRNEPESMRFLRASRELLEDDSSQYKKFLIQVAGSFDLAVSKILEYPTFVQLIESLGRKIEITSPDVIDQDTWMQHFNVETMTSWSSLRERRIGLKCGFGISKSVIYITQPAKDLFELNHQKVRSAAGI